MRKKKPMPISFNLALTAWTYLYGDATLWQCQYQYDTPFFGVVTSDSTDIYSVINFSDVYPEGYVSARIYSPTWGWSPWLNSSYFSAGTPGDGETWQFKLYYHGQSGDLVKLSNVSPGWVMIDKLSTILSHQSGTIQPGWVLIDRVSTTLVRSAGTIVKGWVLIDTATSTLKSSGGGGGGGNTGAISWGKIAIGAGVAVAIGAVIAGSTSNKHNSEAKMSK